MPAPTEYNTREPWARQPFESDSDWALFQDYLASPAPSRSLRELAQRTGAGWSQVEALAVSHAWQARAALWDSHLDAIRRETIETEIREDAKQRAARHLKMLRKAGKIVNSELDRRLDIIKRGAPLCMSDIDLGRWLRNVILTERVVAGDSPDAVSVSVDLSGLSVDELRQAQALGQKVRK